MSEERRGKKGREGREGRGGKGGRSEGKLGNERVKNERKK